MKSRLRRLVEERRRRLKQAEDAWRAKRASVNPGSLSDGEIANMLEGLTPDGLDKRGRKVSFVERGLSRRRGITDSLRGFFR